MLANRTLARRIALRSAGIFAAISALVLIAVWASLSSVASSSITVEPTDGASSAPEVIEAVFRLTNQATATILAVTAAALALLTVLGGFITYRAAKDSLRRVAEIAAHTRRITASTLDERLALDGPRDEITDLADTIDDTLAQLNEAFAQQERFAANASHELRTPLAVVRASLEAIRAREGDVDEIERSRRNIARMDEMISSLLMLAQTKRLPDDHRFAVDIAEVVRIVAEELSPDFAERSVTVRVRADEEAVVRGDPTLITQAVHNLAHNAALYATSGGLATFTVSSSAAEVVARFSNDGPELGESDVAQLAAPFNRGPHTRLAGVAGQGLGLSIVGSIARQHGGVLELKPRESGGLVGILRLPRANAGAEDRLPGPRPAQSSRTVT